MVLAFCQSPGRIVADTKLDLTANPLGFLGRAAHQWSSIAPLGQVQNQAYGYFFPHGAFFALGDLAHVPPWVAQRLWWGLLLAAGFWGVVRVADALRAGSRGSRMIAAAAFALSPRVLTTIGPISSVTLPMMLAPWVLLPVIRALDSRGSERADSAEDPAERRRSSMRVLAARSAAAVALMGAVNAVATGFACLPAVLWWLAHRPDSRWRRFTAWWIPLGVIACLWWIVPLWLLGKVSPPFLDFIESATTTTRFASLPEVLRGTSYWSPFVSPDTATGVSLVSEPILVLATGLLAAAGLAGLAMRRMPAKGRLLLILLVGLAGMTLGYDGALGSAVAEQVRAFLDGAGAPLRNVHKLDPLLRLPLALGLAHLLGRVPLPGAVPWRTARAAAAHPERRPMVAVTALVSAALVLASAPAWTGRLAPSGGYDALPGYWHQAADWLQAHAGPGPGQDHAGNADMTRALVVPGAPFAIQEWGTTRDEPLQPLATTPWAVRDAIPLTPPGAIRALDAVQRTIAAGRPSRTLARSLERMGIGYLVVRNDLDPQLARAPHPVTVHGAVDGSPGLTRVAAFGPPPVPATAQVDQAGDDGPRTVRLGGGLRRDYPAVEIYRVGTRPVSVGPYAADLADVPVVVGGPAVLHRRGVLPPGPAGGRPSPALLYADAKAAGLHPRSVTVTDTPTDREQDYGRVDGGTSGIRAATDARRTANAVADYPVPGAQKTEGVWHGAVVTASGSAADATQLGGVSPASGTAAAFDGDPDTSWVSSGAGSAVGQWLRMDLDAPITTGTVTLRTDPAAAGPPVTGIEIRTAAGTTGVSVDRRGESVTVPLPLGSTSWVRIEAVRTADKTAGRQFGLAAVHLTGDDGPIDIHRTVRVPSPPADAQAARWSLGQEFPGRRQCLPAGDASPAAGAETDTGTGSGTDAEGTGPAAVLCSTGLGAQAESPRKFTRTIDLPTGAPLDVGLTVHARPGDALGALLHPDSAVRAEADTDIVDPRGNASAALDGDPATSWHAATASAHHATSSPTLTLHLPREQTVSSLRITAPRGTPLAAPKVVTVDLGTGPQQREVPESGIIELTPAATDTVTVSVTDWSEVPVRGRLGRTSDAPPGIAGIAAFTGPHATGRIGPIPDPDRLVTVGCDAGPVVTIGGAAVHTSITAPARALRDGDPVAAVPCDAGSVTPDAGRRSVKVDPGPAFTVDTLTLAAAGAAGSGSGDAAPAATPAAPPEAARTTALHISAWGDDHRVIDMPAADHDRLLVVPESTNPGWQARDASGADLEPITVDGWQQGWIVPAGRATTVTLSFPSDHWYRIGLFGGLALLPLLLLAAAVPSRRRERLAFRAAGGPTRTWSSATAALAGALAAGGAVSGIAGAATAAGLAAIGAAAILGARRMRGRAGAIVRAVGTGRAWPVLAGGGVMLSCAVLATGPWLSGTAYQGHSAAAQLPALIAVLAAAVSAVPAPLRLLARARSALRSASNRSAAAGERSSRRA